MRRGYNHYYKDNYYMTEYGIVLKMLRARVLHLDKMAETFQGNSFHPPPYLQVLALLPTPLLALTSQPTSHLSHYSNLLELLVYSGLESLSSLESRSLGSGSSHHFSCLRILDFLSANKNVKGISNPYALALSA